MITPNKFTPLDRSVLAKLEIVLDEGPGKTPIRELYRSIAHQFDTADQFLLAIDVLYILGRLNVDFNTATVSYVD